MALFFFFLLSSEVLTHPGGISAFSFFGKGDGCLLVRKAEPGRMCLKVCQKSPSKAGGETLSFMRHHYEAIGST